MNLNQERIANGVTFGRAAILCDGCGALHVRPILDVHHDGPVLWLGDVECCASRDRYTVLRQDVWGLR